MQKTTDVRDRGTEGTEGTAAPTRLLALAALAGTILAAGACSSSSITASNPEVRLQVEDEAGVVFMTQNVIHEVTMDALFEGAVVEDAEGCLRLDSPDAHAVIWPHGFSPREVDGGVEILDDEGTLVGTVGGEFSLAGGEITTLSDEMGFTQADRDLADSRCPGRYWIVG